MTHDEIVATGLHECVADCPPPVLRTKRRVLGLTLSDATAIVLAGFFVAILISLVLPR